MASAHPDPELLSYVEQNMLQAEMQCQRLASLIKCRRAKGRETKTYEQLLCGLRQAIAHVLEQMPMSAGD